MVENMAEDFNGDNVSITEKDQQDINKLEAQLLADSPAEVQRVKSGQNAETMGPTEQALRQALDSWTPGKLMKTRTNLGQQFYREVGKVDDYKNMPLSRREKAYT